MHPPALKIDCLILVAGIWDGEVPRAQQLRILQEAYTALNNHNMVEFQLEQSVQNCHWMGVYSIRVTPLLRAFIPEENQDDVGLYDNSRPHDHNDRFVMHNHRHDLISLPLSGHQENIKYDETDDHDDDLYVGTYLKAKFYSALFQEDRKAKQVEVGSVKLKRTSYTVNQPWHMDAREIHRIMWQVVDGVPVIALLKEVRDPDAINKQPADWNLPLKASEFPCASHLELYQKLGRDDCIRLRRLLSDAVQASINSLNSVLCVVHSSRSHMKSSRSSFWYNSG